MTTGDPTLQQEQPPMSRAQMFLPGDDIGLNGQRGLAPSLSQIRVAGWTAPVMDEIVKKLKAGTEAVKPEQQLQAPAPTTAVTSLPAKTGPRISHTGPQQVEQLSQQVMDQARHQRFSGEVGEPVDMPPPPTSGVVNFDRIQTSADIKQLIDDIATAQAPEIEKARRGVRTDAETRRDANLMNMGVQDVLNLQALKAEEMFKARQTMVTLAEQVKAAAVKASGPQGTDEDLVALRRLMATFTATQQHVKGLTTETARTLSMMRMPASATLNSSRNIQLFLNEWGGRDANKRMAEMLSSMDLEELGTAIPKTFKATNWDMFMEYWRMGALLTSPATHLMNAQVNLAVATTGIVEHAVGAAIGAGRRALGAQGGTYMAEIPAGVYGLLAGVWDGLKLAGKAMAANETAGDRPWHRPDTPDRRAITGAQAQQQWWGKGLKIAGSALGEHNPFGESGMAWRAFDLLGGIARFSGRALLGPDEFFKAINYSAELHRRAMRQAIDEGMVGPQAAMRYREIVADPQTLAPDVVNGAVDYAKDLTFQRPLGSTAASVFHALSPRSSNVWASTLGKGVDLLLPFKSIVFNSLRYVEERLPGFNFLSEQSRKAITGKLGKAEQDLAVGRLVVGSSIFAWGMWEAANGRLTGGGPLSLKDRLAQQEFSGVKEYSYIFDDGSAVDYRRLGPLGAMLGMAADMTDIYDVLSGQDRDKMLATAALHFGSWFSEEGLNAGGALALAFMRNMGALTPLQGVQNFSQMVQNAQEQGGLMATKTFATTLMASLEPFSGTLNYISTYYDTTRRNPKVQQIDEFGVRQGALETFWKETVNRVKARTPGFSAEVPHRTGFWGQPIKKLPYLWDGASPFQVSKLKWKPSQLEAAGFQANPTTWSWMRYPETIGIEQLTKFIGITGIDGEMIRLGLPVGDHSPDVAGIALSARQQAVYRKAVNTLTAEEPITLGEHVLDIRDMTMRDALQELVRQDWYIAAPEGENITDSKEDFLKSVVDHYRHQDGMRNEYNLAGADRLLYDVDLRFASRIQQMAASREDRELKALFAGGQ